MGDFPIQSIGISSSSETEFAFYEHSFKENSLNGLPFSKDSIASAAGEKTEQENLNEQKNSKGFLEKVALQLSHFWSFLFKEKEVLEAPSKSISAIEDKAQKTKQHFQTEMNEMYKRILEIDEHYKELLKNNPRNKEALLMKLLSLAMRNQLGLKEEESLLLIEKAESKKQERLELNKSQKKVQEELAALAEKSNFTSKLDAVLLIASTVIVLNACGVWNGTPNLKNLLQHIAGFVAFAKSGTLLLDASQKGALEDKRRENYLLSAKKDLAENGIQITYEQLNQATEDIALMWKELRELIEKQKQTSSKMFE